jgi:hypothetical protein
MAVKNSTLNLDNEAVKVIRHALLIGLQSFGEIERVLDHIDGITANGDGIPKLAIPRHPTESADTVSAFASALSYLN